MHPSSAKGHSQNDYMRNILKKPSNDSGIGSLTSSPSRSTRDYHTHSSGIPPSTYGLGQNGNAAAAERLRYDQLPSQRSPPRVAPTDLVEQPTHVRHAHGKVRRVESWLKDQQRVIGDDNADASHEYVAKASGTSCNPYLAYPGLPKITAWQTNGGGGDEDDDTLGSFVIVEEEESEEETLGRPNHVNTIEPPDGFLTTSSASYGSSLRPPSLRPPSILSVSSWRNLSFSKAFPSHRHVTTPGEPIDLSTPPASIRIASASARRRSPIPEDFLQRTAGKSAQSKSSSGTLRPTDTPRNTVRKRLGSFMWSHENSNTSPRSQTSSKSADSPRPSTSASATTATTSTAVENERRSMPGGSPKRFLHKFNLNLTRATRPAPVNIRLDSPTRSSFSTTTLQQEEFPDTPSPLPHQSFAHSENRATPTLSRRPSQSSIFRDKRHNASSSALSTLSMGSIGTMASNINGRACSALSGTSTAKRKRLVVSGIAPDDTNALQGLRRWCESFGELRQVTRMPNGDLIVDFKRADVADTVCRISARVHIADVGSVNMSWISGKKH